MKQIDRTPSHAGTAPRIATAVILLTFFASAAAHAQDRMSFAPESTVLIDGTSNQSDWTVTADSLYGWVEMAATDGGLPEISGVEVHVVSSEIVSNKSPIMDRLMYRTLKTGEFTEIVFALTGADVMPVDGADADTFAVAATGSLSIAGVTHPIEMTVGGERVGGSGYRFTGSYGLKMTDYGMRPPTALFGALHTGDPVVVRFDLHVRNGATGTE